MNPKKLFTVETLPILTKALSNHGLTVLDVGGRGEPLPELTALAPFTHLVVCEPDEGEAVRLESAAAESRWRNATVIRDAFASSPGDATLFLTRRPGMSSLLEPDFRVVRHLPLSHHFDVVGTAAVPTLPLDAAAIRYDFRDTSFIKLDTQGTELDILRSGLGLLANVLGIRVEISYRRLYQRQALAYEVEQFLSEQGFELFALHRTNLRRSGFRADVFSRRITTWAHAVYFREPDTLLHGPIEVQRAQIVRLLALTLAFQFIDVAFEVASTAIQIGAIQDEGGLMGEMNRYALSLTRYRLHEKAQAERDAELAATFKDKRQRE